MDLVDGSMLVNGTGLELYCRYWKKELVAGEKPKGLVFISHGFAEHCSTYDHVAKRLTPHKFFVFAHDHVGHGRSQGERTMVSQFTVFTNDVLQHVDLVKESFPDIPVFLIGHSLGGLISVWSVLTRPEAFKGVVLVAPALNNESSAFKVMVSKFMSFVYPSYGLLRIDTKMLSRDPEEVKKKEDDPLLYKGLMKAGLFVKILKAYETAKGRYSEIKTPFLILQGTGDLPGFLEGSKKFYQEISSNDKKILIYEEGRHQLHCEIPDVQEEVLTEIENWYLARC